MIHYHGTPITPQAVLYTLAGRHFCVSHAAPGDVARAHAIGQSVMLDNGAFSAWMAQRPTDWPGYYAWCDRWLDHPATWAVIPDVIDGGAEAQDALLLEWPHGDRGAPVWHMDEPHARLMALCDEWPLVCIGSTAKYRFVMSDPWQRHMDLTFNELARTFGRMPRLHMLRGMQCAGHRWPFHSVDSTDVARNHNRAHNSAEKMAKRWDAMQSPPWTERPEQMEIAI